MDPQSTSKPPPQGKSAVPLMYGSFITYQLLALVFICLRFYCKRMVRAKWFFAEDFALVAAWVFELVYISLALWLTNYGYAVPLMDIFAKDPNFLSSKLPTLLRWSPPVLLFGTWGTALSKISFCLTLLRLVKNVTRWQTVALWFLLVSITGVTIVMSVIMFFQCHFSGFPSPIVSQSVCVGAKVVYHYTTFQCVYQACVDFALAAAPTIVIWKTNIGNTRQKSIIISAMSLGFIAGAIGIAKTVVNAKVQENGDTYGIGVVLVLSQAEVSAAIIAACVPFCRPLVRKFSSKENSDEESGGRAQS
ncbi:hypothetical protein B0T20DRAFT_414900 [Sordaria brevicollis]|uniref:Rhodopsin domain-containing protein n=1 Tax=Sordaria brevicollis TaxID=83679 RepID=A0AAE0UAG4_SORBR|nr:hypothetical protein B0T20DRAFT_414900 [Sordaria brevicollis]